jgi:hypothetical protein
VTFRCRRPTGGIGDGGTMGNCRKNDLQKMT